MTYALIMRIIFFILTIQTVFTLLCTIFLFIQFVLNREIRQQRNNHVLFILLFVTFLQDTIELPMGLIYLRTGLAAYSSINFCLFWTFCTCCLDVIGLLLMAFASFERYMFIFHGTFLRKHPIILRYIPISFCFIYPFFYFIGMIYILPCSHEFYYFAYLCGGGCYLYDPLWNAITWLANVCTPVFVILLLNILLIIHTLYQKNRMKQRNVWLKNRKMLLQLVSVALLYCLAWLPNVILILIVTFPLPNVNTPRIFIIFQYTIFMTGFTPLLYPFVCLFGQPVILKKIKQTFQRRDFVTPVQHLSYRNK